MRTAVITSNTSHPLCRQLVELLEEHLEAREPTLVPIEQAEGLLLRFRPEMLVIVLSPNPDRILQTLAKMRAHVGGTILAVGPTNDSKLILRAMHEGVGHYLDESNLAHDFEAVLPRLQNTSPSPRPSQGRTISVLATAGGSGSSTVAVNLAVALALEAARCALVDLKPGVGDLAALLDLKPTHTLADLCHNPGRVDQAMLQKALVTHSCGVGLIAPPQLYDDVRLLTPQGIHKVLFLAREAFPFVVVDQEDCFHEEQVMALREADSILLVARLDFTSLRNTRRIIEYLGQMSVPKERIEVVVNRQGQPKELPVAEVAQALQLELRHVIPDDPATVNGANNNGVPVLLKSPSSRVAQAISRLAKSFLPPGPSADPRPVSPSKSAVMRWLAPFR